jgi:hypothetical protein
LELPTFVPNLISLQCHHNKLITLELSPCYGNDYVTINCRDNPFCEDFNFDVNKNLKKYIQLCKDNENYVSPIMK